MKASLPVVGRSCGPCSACCTSLGVEEINKPRDTPCVHQCGQGCSIYESRPPSCQTYHCLWLAGLIEGDERRRPDQLGVIFDEGSTLEDVITCREIVPEASESEPVRYLIKKLSTKLIVFVMRLDGGRKVYGNPHRIRQIMQDAIMLDQAGPKEFVTLDGKNTIKLP